MIKFNGLDGMRSFACIGFVAMHVRGNLHVRPSFNMLIDNVLDCAGDFVLLFMMISAFSLCCGYWLQRDAGVLFTSSAWKTTSTALEFLMWYRIAIISVVAFVFFACG